MRAPGLTAVLVVLILSLTGASVRAQTPNGVTPLDHLPALRGDYFRIDSDATGRPYHIYVRYPEGYDPAADVVYPTVYLTDGDSLFPILAANHLFLHYDERLPEALVVGMPTAGSMRR
nr:esterase family protein [Brevundimonas denitrificans]